MSNKMTQGFDEWLFNHNHESIPEFSESAFKAGAASCQAEIDELQKRINLALAAVWNDECSHTIIDILRGKKDE